MSDRVSAAVTGRGNVGRERSTLRRAPGLGAVSGIGIGMPFSSSAVPAESHGSESRATTRPSSVVSLTVQIYRPFTSVLSVTSVAKKQNAMRPENCGKGKPQRSQRPRRLRESGRTSKDIGVAKNHGKNDFQRGKVDGRAKTSALPRISGKTDFPR